MAITGMTTRTTADDVFYDAYINEGILEVLRANTVCAPLCRQESLQGKASLAMDFVKETSSTVNQLTEGTDMTLASESTDKVTITGVEYGVGTILSDLSFETSIAGWNQNRIVRKYGKDLANNVDAIIADLFTSFTSSVGATGTATTEANIRSAINTLEVADADGLGDIVFVLHPYQIGALRANVVGLTGTPLSQVNAPEKMAVKRNGYEFSFWGADFFSTTNVDPTSGTNTGRSGAAFIKDYAIGLATLRPARTELERDASGRGTEIVSTQVFGTGIVENTAGVEVIGKNAAA